ncbi:MAG: hypothetical protein V3V14_07290 [Saprospiraceae bacterium]
MDFRMDKSSIAIIVFMLATVMYFMLSGGTSGLGVGAYLQSFGFGLMTTVAAIAIMSIPVLIICYFAKVIPDIDYSIRAAFVLTIIGIISEFIF